MGQYFAPYGMHAGPIFHPPSGAEPKKNKEPEKGGKESEDKPNKEK
jgi:hypothetical protein